MNNVLIVDDEPLIREGICYGIERDNLLCNTPLCAENGLDAIDLIKRNNIGIVITDIKMPGINGIELARWIHENYPSIKVIMLTGLKA